MSWAASPSINHVHGAIAHVHVTADVYVDYLQLVHVEGRLQILNALWAPAHPAPAQEVLAES